MEIISVENRKRDYLDLLLMADEELAMIDKYLDEGDLYIMKAGKVVAAAVVITRDSEQCELKNIAVEPGFRRKGWGRKLVTWLIGEYSSRGFREMYVGTGEVPSTLGFYQSCGFTPSHRVPNFFLEHYSRPIIEDGMQLTDMVYLKMALQGNDRH